MTANISNDPSAALVVRSSVTLLNPIHLHLISSHNTFPLSNLPVLVTILTLTYTMEDFR
uniref:Uncharacterized protein n=1 Tax=Mesocestoides corti TaxID=53468 RepID=A0A5K3EU07_MESCO